MEIIKAYFQEFSAIKRYMDNAINTAREKEYVETLMGRRRYLRDINSRNASTRGFAERNAINAPIQGTAADIIKIAMVNIHDWLQKQKMKTRMTMQVHDELVFDVHKSEVDVARQNVTRLMCSAVQLEVPMEVEVGVGENGGCSTAVILATNPIGEAHIREIRLAEVRTSQIAPKETRIAQFVAGEVAAMEIAEDERGAA